MRSQDLRSYGRSIDAYRTFSEELIVGIPREAERGDGTVAEAVNAHGVAEKSVCRWRRRYEGVSVPETRLLLELERETSRLRRGAILRWTCSRRCCRKTRKRSGPPRRSSHLSSDRCSRAGARLGTCARALGCPFQAASVSSVPSSRTRVHEHQGLSLLADQASGLDQLRCRRSAESLQGE